MRKNLIQLGAIQLQLPVLFLSVSSVKTTLPPVEYVRLLLALRSIAPEFLVSAFDVIHANDEAKVDLQRLLREAREKECIVLLDSGNYESYWKEAKSSWCPENFYEAIQLFGCSFAFGFDNQNPPNDINAHKELLCRQHQKDQTCAGDIPVVPIIHGKLNLLPELCQHVVSTNSVQMIAVAERWLGEGVFDRAKTVAKIRKALDATGRFVALHLLGTGNPISIALYASAGADSFDGLEWCQTVVDHETGHLFHFSQADFFNNQTLWGDQEIAFQPKTLAHNIEFYFKWMKRLRHAATVGEIPAFCRVHFSERIYSKCAIELGWNI
jgi:hypothetical protein